MMYVWRPGESSTPSRDHYPAALKFSSSYDCRDRFPRMRAVRAAPLRLLRASKCARRRLAPCCRASAKVGCMRPREVGDALKLVETSVGVRGMSQRNSTTQRLVFAAQHARELAG